jgi:hypothetical protein
VTANIANAITRDMALNIAQGFAGQVTSPAAK